jgi:hypothetical protein
VAQSGDHRHSIRFLTWVDCMDSHIAQVRAGVTTGNISFQYSFWRVLLQVEIGVPRCDFILPSTAQRTKITILAGYNQPPPPPLPSRHVNSNSFILDKNTPAKIWNEYHNIKPLRELLTCNDVSDVFRQRTIKSVLKHPAALWVQCPCVSNLPCALLQWDSKAVCFYLIIHSVTTHLPQARALYQLAYSMDVPDDCRIHCADVGSISQYCQ